MKIQLEKHPDHLTCSPDSARESQVKTVTCEKQVRVYGPCRQLADDPVADVTIRGACWDEKLPRTT